ncbi:hypothetical protein TCAL_06467 [Tigriopus californicus]|uniref:SID1 transmembrane family member 1 n=1 Tax=Tigriopus californicus TaxID=6832 RepID=A0A553PJV2_TIGCA|nr:SID1 transmembrane family member 1-like [Tigriopus californicus]TRY77952.1 hypothetical protein TCAL_06467 [Tigriopus californicus]|eukprot:TCALIF_06467-PA protein Name:"Similar to SIDT1 SID1 transmembrane family member 1 (Homo sapiens)" AED:0.05 eAED:0.05 QI:0/-1/0/1/-1/1/1/0/816
MSGWIPRILVGWILIHVVQVSKVSPPPLIRPEVTLGQLGRTLSGRVDATTEQMFQFNVELATFDSTSSLRVFISCPTARVFAPLIVMTTHQQGVSSWQIPLPVVSWTGQHHYYDFVNRTLCPSRYFPRASAHGLPQTPLDDGFMVVTVSVSTSNVQALDFTLQLYEQKVFQVAMDQTYTFEITPSAPMFYFFPFVPGDVTMMPLLTVQSDSSLCMTLAVQNATCPVHDMDRALEFDGFYQTLDTLAGASLSPQQFPEGVFLTFMLKTDDEECVNRHAEPSWHGSGKNRLKRVEFKIQANVTMTDYLVATFATLIFVGLIYFTVILIFCVAWLRHRHRPQDDQESLIPIAQDDNSVTNEEEIGQTVAARDCDHIETLSEDSSLDETDLDALEDANFEKDVYRTKKTLYLSDLARKSPRVLAKKSNLYHWNLWTIAIFYGLPVIQLVLTFQDVSNRTGNQDLCYYNFLCAHPLGFLADFNHIYSNIGYALFGMLFMAITYVRQSRHNALTLVQPRVDVALGIPQHFGMYYAMGLALIMEGIMSACYHVCPSHNNFQFDTAFMYTIAILILLKIYQTRHPDINANAYTAFGTLAFVISLGVMGVLHGNVYFWILFTSLHVLSSLFLSLQIYYLGRFRLDSGVFRRLSVVFCNDFLALLSGNCRALLPVYPDRFILLLVLNLANWGLSAYGVTVLAWKGGDFASFLLAILIGNVLLYTFFYIIMKLRHGERIGLEPALYIGISCITWGGSMYFFLNKSTSWVFSPAQSRHYNQECQLLRFYDNHDIWHLLSSLSLFLDFMILLTLDDDLKITERTCIKVF